LEKYQNLSNELHADKSKKDSLENLKYKAEIEYNASYPKSIEEIGNNKKLVEQYDFVTILLIMGASLGGISEIAKNKPLGYSAFIFGALGVIMLLLTIITPQELNATDALNNKGDALKNLGNYTEAIEYYDIVLSIEPNNTDALNNKGDALKNLGNYTEAKEYYAKALAIDPNDVNVLNGKGFALANIGRN